MVLEDYTKHIYRCARVGWCRSPIFKDKGINKLCPIYEYHLWECFSARGIMAIAQTLLEGNLRIDDFLAEIVYKCMLCGGCHEICVIHFPVVMGVSEIDELDHISVIEELRARLVEQGFLRISAHKKSLESLSRYGNPFGISRYKERLRWTSELKFKIKRMPKQRSDILLYTGSMYSLEPLVRGTIKSIARVLNAANVDFGILECEIDDGLYALQLGERGLFEELAERNQKVLNNLGIETLVTPDPHAYHSFKKHYPQIGGINAEVVHITEFVEKLIEKEKIRIRKPQRGIVTYHDPCNLGRITNVYDAPRKIISAIKGVELREMGRIKHYAWCCGAGGGVAAAYPEFMAWTARERIKEAELIGASSLITACPWCEYSLKVSKPSDSAIEVQNIIELVEKSLG